MSGSTRKKKKEALRAEVPRLQRDTRGRVAGLAETTTVEQMDVEPAALTTLDTYERHLDQLEADLRQAREQLRLEAQELDRTVRLPMDLNVFVELEQRRERYNEAVARLAHQPGALLSRLLADAPQDTLDESHKRAALAHLDMRRVLALCVKGELTIDAARVDDYDVVTVRNTSQDRLVAYTVVRHDALYIRK